MKKHLIAITLTLMLIKLLTCTNMNLFLVGWICCLFHKLILDAFVIWKEEAE